MFRRSFLPVTESHDIAAKADLRSLREYFHLLVGPINPEIHRQTKNPVYSSVPGKKIPRMPNAAVTRGIFARDGLSVPILWYEGDTQGSPKGVHRTIPHEARWESSNEGKHFGLSTLTASIDHLVPYKRGGANGLDNLVTACGPCQFGRNRWLLEEVEIENPFKFPPIVDEWDGLARLKGLKSMK